MDNERTLLKFPCEFVIKVFGTASDEFETVVITIVRKHAQDLREDALKVRASKDGKYLAMSFSIRATSQEQLDNIYRELSACPLVLMAL